MNSDGYQRKITAIMSADVVGYSKLMGDDEEATVRTLSAYKNIMSALIDQHRGRVIDSPGDNMLSEFPSVVDAVQCAVAIQKELKSRNAELPEDRKMQFRIGINLGDVIQEKECLYGDGVNIAARLEALADPGGICVSRTAFDHIETKLPFGYEFMGDQEVKNIAKPVGAYRVLMDPRILVAEKTEKIIPFWRKKSILSYAAIFIVLIGGMIIWMISSRSVPIEPVSKNNMVFDLPEKPSIAVLPFNNLGGDPEQEYFSDGLTEEIITALSKIPQIFVIASNSVFSYKGKAVKVNQIAEELGVRYILEGSIRKAENHVRINAQLVDAISGHHLWAERYDRNLEEIFAVQEDLAKNIITAMQVKLTGGEQIRVAAKDTDNLEAFLKYLQASDYFNQSNPESMAQAKRLAQEAIALDSDYAMPYVIMAKIKINEFWVDKSKSQEELIDEAEELLHKAISLNDSYAEAHSQLGFLYIQKEENEKALNQAQKAISLNPNSAEAHYGLAKVFAFSVRNEEAILEYKKAIRLNPIPPSTYFWSLGLAYAWIEQYEEGINWCKKAIVREPNSFMARIMMTGVYSMSGRNVEARKEALEVIRINPNFSLERFGEKAHPRLTEALRKAGLK